MTIGQRIKAIRKEKGLKAERIADIMGVNKSTYYRWESGMINNMRVDHFLELCEILDASPAEMLTGIKEKKFDWRMGQ